MAQVGHAGAAPERLHALDAVRGFALLLGIVLHATMSFLPAPTRIWIIQDNHPSITLGVLFFAIHVFRMTTFFLIAGFFAHMSFHRRGARGFITDRLLENRRAAAGRLADFVRGDGCGGVLGRQLPARWSRAGRAGMAAGIAEISPDPSLVSLCAAGILRRGAGAARRRGLARPERPLPRRRRPPDRSGDAQSAWLPRSWPCRSVSAFSLDHDVAGVAWRADAGPDPLVTNLQAVIGFGTAFCFGWLLHRQIELLRMLERRWLLNLDTRDRPDRGQLLPCRLPSPLRPQSRPTPIRRLAGAACYALAIWTTTFAMIGLALRFLSGFSATRRYLADASYWLYLIHLPIVMALQVAVSAPRLALAGQIRSDPAGRPRAHVSQLPGAGTLHLHWRGAEWPSHGPPGKGGRSGCRSAAS